MPAAFRVDLAGRLGLGIAAQMLPFLQGAVQKHRRIAQGRALLKMDSMALTYNSGLFS